MIIEQFIVYSLQENRVLKEYNFNEVGVTIVLGDKKDEKDESNGSGKTTLIECIRFLLGQKINKYYLNSKELLIKDIFIILKLRVNNKTCFVGRRFSDSQNGYYLESLEKNFDLSAWKCTPNDEYKNLLTELALGNKESDISLAFLIDYLIRDEQGGYLKERLGIVDRSELDASRAFSFLVDFPYNAEKQIKEYSKEIAKFKKDIDIQKSINKYKITELKAMKKSVEKDIKELSSNIDKIDINKKYNIDANLYNKIKNDLNIIQKDIHRKEFIKNQYEKNIINLNSKVENIKELVDIKQFYDDLINFFPNKIEKSISELEKFHNFMLENRGTYYRNKILTVEKELNPLFIVRNQLQEELDEVTKLLKETNLINDINTMVESREKLNIKLAEINIGIQSYEDAKLKKANILEKESAKLLLLQEKLDEFESQEEVKSYIEGEYTNLARLAYPNSESDLTIEFDTETKGGQKATTGRITFDCSLSYDRSHGIAYMKNNLFDLSIFFANLVFSNNAIGFLIHDGSYSKNNEYVKQRIIDEVNRKLKELSIGQYIITINKNELTSETIKKYTEEGLIKIKLDRSVDENRLFGYKF